MRAKEKRNSLYVLLPLIFLLWAMFFSVRVMAAENTLLSGMQLYSANSRITIYSKPDESSEVIGYLEEGTSFFAAECEDGWLETPCSVGDGFVVNGVNVSSYADANPELTNEMEEFSRASEEENAVIEAVEEGQKEETLKVQKESEELEAQRVEMELAKKSRERNTIVIIVIFVFITAGYLFVRVRKKNEL